ncbi:SagB/ThcOx family dehydrogenase [Candidatus Thorarchaeota archaeon]|nr:MAG: SagB/ThcOx family dehydrogenase [Candidatus Thorarchaeota archaeon]
MKERRKFLHFFDSEEYKEVVPESDEQKKVSPPLFQQPYPEDSPLIDLIPPNDFTIGKAPFLDLVNHRQSRRKYTSEPLTLEELSFLLWSTQGVKQVLRSGSGVKRTVPSAGAKSPLETYLVINRVTGLEPGLYRYISFSHKLLFIKRIDNAEETMGKLSFEQMFVGKAPVIFCWTAVPYRTEWRYTILSHKFIAIDLGIVCQNLYLACEAINLGTVAIGYYEQNKLDELFDLNTDEEFVVLLAPVGRYRKQKKLTEFFKYPKKEVTLVSLKKLEGKYKRKNLVEFIVKNDHLVIKIGEFEEILEPYNEIEFIGEMSARAMRFEFTKEGKPEKVVVLNAEDEEFELECAE